ncbi:MAG: HAD hydrolase family protein [Candidatus Onthomorpha sp.]|nr:HAD hydrolase family protein [Bacteroidales bacterium]MDY4583976.1 HAD hydrolase family protein [Candidatus Onthomorpha sp.]MCI5716592.1 HAD hydrolase family protein [Bacteroidales bacterium]MCI6416268.1 HAD hydrolase family protein [Bacteroidales bacterium]MCI6645683.1 HAD hydrolase family protein [Bacteroidales bacterium]
MNYKAKLHEIKAFVFDYDGVISDGNIWSANDTIIVRSGNVKDGYAMQYALRKGYLIAILSGGSGDSIRSRMKMLGVEDVYLGSHRKKEIFEDFLKDKQLLPEQVLYVGDDIPDYDVMRLAGVSACPADAAEEIKAVADYISHKNGGCGCVRDVIEQVLRLQGQWFHEDAKAW